MIMFDYDYLIMIIFVITQVINVILDPFCKVEPYIREEIPGGANENLSRPFFAQFLAKIDFFAISGLFWILRVNLCNQM